MAIIGIENISFSYNGGLVLNKVSDSIASGEFIGITGPNGSGKTTLMRCMNGILKPREGKILLDNENISGFSPRRLAKKIAYLPQTFENIFPSTVFDTVLMGRKPYLGWAPSKKDLDITSEIIIKLDLSEIILKDINKLSGGQRQRVFIGRALAQEPSVILLDEPTANLDLHHQHEVMALLQELSKKGITVIIAIHDLNLAMQYCSRFLMLNEGKIAANGRHEIFKPDLIEKVYKVKVNIFEDEQKNKFIIPIKASQS